LIIPSKDYTTLNAKNEIKIPGSSIDKDDLIVLGCKAISGVFVTDMAADYKINCQFVFTQKKQGSRHFYRSESWMKGLRPR